jgi:hypothetical protein
MLRSAKIGSMNAIEPGKRALDAIDKVLETQVSPKLLDDLFEVQLTRLAQICTSLDSSIEDRADTCLRVLASPAAARDPWSSYLVGLMSQGLVQKTISGNIMELGRGSLAIYSKLLPAADATALMRQQCLLVCFAHPVLFESVWIQPNFNFDEIYGKDGSWLMEAASKFDYDTYHARFTSQMNGDCFNCCGGTAFPLLHYGDIAGALLNADRSFGVISRVLAEPVIAPERFSLLCGIPMWSFFCYATEMPMDRSEALVSLHKECNLGWSGAEKAIDLFENPMLRLRGDTEINQQKLFSAEHLTWVAKCSYVLVASKLEVSSTDIMQSLPTVFELQQMCMMNDACAPLIASWSFLNLFVYVAAACEKLGEHERVLAYTEAALETDLTKAGGRSPVSRAYAHSMQGRAYAALGRTADAGLAFEAGAKEAGRHQLWLLEALALRDLKLLVLDELGHGEHAARRLGAVLRLLSGPLEAWAPLLKGLDAADLVRLRAPDPAYLVAYATEDPAVAELRAGLEGLRVMALQRRATQEGVGAAAVEGAMGGAAPRAALVELLLERGGAAASAEHARRELLRTELLGMRMLGDAGLQQRATDQGVAMASLEDAMDGDNPKDALIELIISTAKE